MKNWARMAAVVAPVLLTLACSSQVQVTVLSSVSPTQSSASPTPVTPGRVTNGKAILLSSGGNERMYRLHVPIAAPDGPRPLIIALHDGGSSPAAMEYGIGLDAAADRAGLFVVYPEGVGGYWNNGRPQSVLRSGGVDDFGFVNDVVTNVRKIEGIDRNRIFLAGQGDGAALALELAAKYPDVFSGVVAISGQFVSTPGLPLPTSPMSAIFIHGTNDPNFPVAGDFTSKNAPIDSLTHTINTYLAVDGLPGQGTTKDLPDPAPLDGTQVTKTIWGPAANGISVTLYTVLGGGSPWPGGDVSTRDLATNGRPSLSLDASAIVEHFALDTKRLTPVPPQQGPSATASS
jgi:polyhydroxybutyrate depolymerase